MKAANIISPQVSLTKYHIIEVGYRNKKSYEAGHIPSAEYIDSTEFETLPLWNYKTSIDIQSVFNHYHLHPSDPILLYGRKNAAAARFGILLLLYGFENVSLLDGGFDLWSKDHILCKSIPASKRPTNNDRYSIKRPWLVKNYKDICSLSSSIPLISIRSEGEYIGKISGYSYINKKGKIPGSIHGGDLSLYRQNNGCFITANTFYEHFNTFNISKKDQGILYCGTGWRASEVLFLALSYGYNQLSLYDGGWFEWSTLSL